MNPIDLATSFAGRPDLASLWQRVRAGAVDLSPREQILLTLAECRAHEKAGNIAEATRLAQDALNLAKREKFPEGIAGGLTHLANIHYRLGHYAECVQLANESLNQALDNPETVTALLLLGLCAIATNDWNAAEHNYLRAADVSRQINYPLGLTLNLLNLSVLHFARGAYDLSLAEANEFQAVARTIGYPIWLGLLTIASIHMLQGHRTRTRQTFDELASLATPDSLSEGFLLVRRAFLELDEDDWESAEQDLTRARRIADRLGDPILQIELHIHTGRMRLLQGNAHAAREWSNEAVVISQRHHIQALEAQALIYRAQANWALGKVDTAEQDLKHAIEQSTLLGANANLAWAMLFLAGIRHQLEHPDAQATALDAAKRIRDGGYTFLLERSRAFAFPVIGRLARSREPQARVIAEQLLDQLTRVAPLPLRIVGMGHFEVNQGRRRIADDEWSKRKVGEIFRFLLCQPQYSAPRDVVLESLWPEHSPESSQALLHQATFTLRRILEPELPNKFPSRYLAVENETISLHFPSGSVLDAEQFEIAMRGALAHDTFDELKNACALYTGDLFPQDRYADWAAGPRERLLRLYLRGLLALAERQLLDSHPQDALDTCQRLIERDSYEEDAVLVGMRACLALNDRPGALRLYRQMEHTLKQEMDLKPRADLTALADSLC